MNQTLTLLSANALLVLVFLLTAIAIYRYVTHNTVLLWMMAALAVAGVEIVMTISDASPSPLFTATANMLNVVCSLCVAKLALIYNKSRRRWPITLWPALLINIVGSAALIGGYGYLSGAIPLQAAAAIPMLETAWLFVRNERKKPVAQAIGVVFFIAAINFLARIPVILIMLDFDTSRPAVLAFQPMAWSMYMVSFLLPIAALLIFASVVAEVLSGYKDQSVRDPLTNIANRRGFNQQYDDLSADGGVLIYADIDHFKRVNDTYGHAVGDRVICTFANLLMEIGCMSGRIGGEEFAVFLPRAELNQGHMVAEGLRTALSLQRVAARNEEISVTASFGVTKVQPGEILDAVSKRADAALYKAKELGRNQVYIGSSDALKAAA